MLLLDDEADNASINTNREDLDPTRGYVKNCVQSALSSYRDLITEPGRELIQRPLLVVHRALPDAGHVV